MLRTNDDHRIARENQPGFLANAGYPKIRRSPGTQLVGPNKMPAVDILAPPSWLREALDIWRGAEVGPVPPMAGGSPWAPRTLSARVAACNPSDLATTGRLTGYHSHDCPCRRCNP